MNGQILDKSGCSIVELNKDGLQVFVFGSNPFAGTSVAYSCLRVCFNFY